MVVGMFTHILEMQNQIKNNGAEPNPFIMFEQMKYFPFVMLGFTIFQFAWQWSVGVSLHPKLPKQVKMNLNVFKAFLIIPFVYIVVISMGMGSVISNMSESTMRSTEGQPSEDLINMIKWFPIFILLHLFSMFCLFYTIYFLSKELRAVEKQDYINGNDYIGEFFMNWFLPVGIWFLQPRINKIFNPKEEIE
jgi:hypothetical protein